MPRPDIDSALAEWLLSRLSLVSEPETFRVSTVIDVLTRKGLGVVLDSNESTLAIDGLPKLELVQEHGVLELPTVHLAAATLELVGKSDPTLVMYGRRTYVERAGMRPRAVLEMR